MIQSWENKKKEKARLRLDIREVSLSFLPYCLTYSVLFIVVADHPFLGTAE